jgi:hypothetical protein
MTVTSIPREVVKPKDFYVYIHLKADTREPFYVGKGEGSRAWHSSPAKRGRWWHSTVAKHGFVVVIVQDGLQEWAAYELERDLIALHGRRDLGLGPLTNLSDGGEGGATGSLRTKEAKEKLSADKKFFFANNPDAKAKAQAHLQRLRNLQEKAILCNGVLHFKSLKDAVHWLQTKKRSRVKASASSISNAASGRAPKAYGYHWAYVDSQAASVIH